MLIFMTSFGSPPRLSCQRHSAIKTGTKTMLMNGSMELNQDVGMWNPKASRFTCASIQTRPMLEFW